MSAAGARTLVKAAPASSPAVDCFYVYPTVSPEKGLNADLRIQAAEIGVAEQQASRFSSVCRVWAPMYRQATLGALTAGVAPLVRASDVAFHSLQATFEDYLAHDNHRRPIVFIGHSQGAAMLIRLLRTDVDQNAALRRQMVSAVILGGNVEVRDGSAVGGSFAHIPACRNPRELHCVIAYSSFLTAPPAGSLFGRPGLGVSLMSGSKAGPGLQVLCTNPADLAAAVGQAAPLRPYLRGAPTGIDGSAWTTYPGLYTSTCKSAGGATWLQVTPTHLPGDTRPLVTEQLGPAWGLHILDVNIALGNLVSDVESEVSALGTG